MAALRHAHGHALIGDLRGSEPDEAEHDRVILLCSLAKKLYVLSDGIGQDGLEGEAFLARDEFLSQPARDVGSGVRVDVERVGDRVRIDEAQPCGLDERFEERGLACTVRPRDGDDDGLVVEKLGVQVYFAATK